MRLRALVLLLALTAGDYLLWDWSIADGHDILSLVAGLTLLPLGAVSLGGLVLAGGRLVGFVLGRSSSYTRALTRARTRQAFRENHTPERPPQASAPESDSSSGRMAA